MEKTEIETKIRKILAQNSPGIGPNDVSLTTAIKDVYYSSETKTVYVNRVCLAFGFIDCTDFSNKTFTTLSTGQKAISYIHGAQ